MKQIPNTNDLIERLHHAKSAAELDQIASKTTPAPTFPDYIEQKRREADMPPAELIERAHLQRNYGYQILNGTKRPGRDKVIALCLALHLSFEETQRALTISKEGSLYPKNLRDSVLIFSIHQKLSVMDTNALLDERGEAPLS